MTSHLEWGRTVAQRWKRGCYNADCGHGGASQGMVLCLIGGTPRVPDMRAVGRICADIPRAFNETAAPFM